MQYSSINTSLLLCALQLSLTTILPTEQVKVTIKAYLEDSCIRAKSSREVVIEKCYWKGNSNNSNRKVLEKEQTFDVHPADITEHQGEETQDGSNLPKLFLIRISKSQKSGSASSNTAATTSCLASISSKLSVEKCQLRKARFRISGNAFLKSANFPTLCSNKPDNIFNTHHVHFKICLSDQSCLEFKRMNATAQSFAFTKEPTEKLVNLKQSQTHLWQFCGKNGNCSLSQGSVRLGSLIKVDYTEQINRTVCKDEEQTTPMTSISTTANSTINDIENEETTTKIYLHASSFMDNSTNSTSSSAIGSETLLPVQYYTIICISLGIFSTY